MSSHATLSAATDDRKARLAKLRSIKRKQPDDEIVPPESERASPAVPLPELDTSAGGFGLSAEPDVSRLHLSGRNYDPELRGAKLGFEAPPNLVAGAETVEVKVSQLEADVRRQQEEEDIDDQKNGNSSTGINKGIDLFKLQPKKPNWDLKRELNKRLEPLNMRTDNAIARLVRERLTAKLQPGTLQAPKREHTFEDGNGEGGEGQGGLEGIALVESLRAREQEQQDEERREQEADEIV